MSEILETLSDFTGYRPQNRQREEKNNKKKKK